MNRISKLGLFGTVAATILMFSGMSVHANQNTLEEIRYNGSEKRLLTNYDVNGNRITHIEDSAGNIRLITGLGYPIDITKPGYSGENIITGADILDRDFLNSRLLDSVLMSYDKVVSVGYNGSDSVEIYQSIKTQVKAGETFGLDEKYIKANIKASLDLGYKSQGNQETYKFYSGNITSCKKYSFSLPDITNTNLYTSNLSDGYLNDLDLYMNNKMSPNVFFSKYGTHLVVKNFYGGSLVRKYLYSSMEYELTENLKEELNLTLEKSIFNIKLAEGKFEVKASVDTTTNKVEYYEESLLLKNGGDYTISNGKIDEKGWVASLNDNPTIINSQVLPLYDLLPAKYRNNQYMKKLMMDTDWYINTRNIDNTTSTEKRYVANYSLTGKNILLEKPYTDRYLDFDFSDDVLPSTMIGKKYKLDFIRIILDVDKYNLENSNLQFPYVYLQAGYEDNCSNPRRWHKEINLLRGDFTIDIERLKNDYARLRLRMGKEPIQILKGRVMIRYSIC